MGVVVNADSTAARQKASGVDEGRGCGVEKR